MPRKVKDKLDELPPARQKKVEGKASMFLAEYERCGRCGIHQRKGKEKCLTCGAKMHG